MLTPAYHASPGATADLTGYEPILQTLLTRLFPICRSISGNGVRQSLGILGEHLPLTTVEVPSGTQVFDWEVPPEWNIREAWIADAAGTRVVDFGQQNLHVVSYSTPIHARLSYAELRPHLHALPELPDAIPYVTSYYNPNWGFCLTKRTLDTLDQSAVYEVHIDADLRPGSLTWAETTLPGESDQQVLFSSYCCHPSMANNELSGPLLMVGIYRYLNSLPRRRFTYRFFLGPETIGALCFLQRYGEELRRRLHCGLVLTCCGDAGTFTYKRTRRPDNAIDPVAEHCFRHCVQAPIFHDFFPSGSDDRQYCSPGFNLPVGSFMRSMYAAYPQYHTSQDDLSFVTAAQLMVSLRMLINVVYALERNGRYRNTKPFGEPQLGKYGLYQQLGAARVPPNFSRLLRYVLNFSDGEHDLIAIANRAAAPLWAFDDVVARLLAAGLITRQED